MTARPQTAPDNTVTLKVAGQLFTSWTEVSVERSLATLAGAFTVKLTDIRKPDVNPIVVSPGEPCALAIGGTTLLTGYVDDVQPSYTGTSHDITIRGRDRTGDLVDCSATPKGPGYWAGTSVLDIGKQLCQPFGIKVTSTEADASKVLNGHAVQMGETVFECLDRAVRQYGLLAVSDGLGDLVLTRPGTAGALAEVRLGHNCLGARGRFSDRETFQKYYVMGQFPGGGEAYTDPTITNGAVGQASDPNVTRFRPLIVFAESTTCDTSFLPKRAAWEAAVRSGRAHRATLTVPGWRDADGKLYAPNTMVRVEDDWLRIHETLLVEAVHLIDNDQAGMVTRLDVVRKEAWLPEPVSTLPPYEKGGSK